MTDIKRIAQLMAELRKMGCAVAIFTPEELRGADPEIVEDRIIERGWDVIEILTDLHDYVVLYRTEEIMSPLDAPFAFECQAEDKKHAEEQCLNAYPDCLIVWTTRGDDVQDALDEYSKNEVMP